MEISTQKITFNNKGAAVEYSLKDDSGNLVKDGKVEISREDLAVGPFVNRRDRRRAMEAKFWVKLHKIVDRLTA